MKALLEIGRRSVGSVVLLLNLAAAIGCAADGNLASLVTTITNSAPGRNELFGVSVTPVGASRLLVGTGSRERRPTNAGSLWLVDLNGRILNHFFSPTSQAGDGFGNSVAVLNSDQVLVGAPNDNAGAEFSGSAHLLSLSGGMGVSFTNPAPASVVSFGAAVATLGPDLVLIGAPRARLGDLAPGAAYMFSASGTLISTFLNPTPEIYGEDFGGAILAIGTDRVLIGASRDFLGGSQVGAAYLFGTNGVLLLRIANPIPTSSDEFGYSLAALGENLFVVGAPGASVGGVRTGAAFVFASDGSMLTTLTNPAPQSNDDFGHSVVGLGNSRVLVSALGASSAYLFSTNGALLGTFESPRKPHRDGFGWSLAALGNDRVAIGTLDEYAGAAYLFSIPQPLMKIGINTSTVSISWAWPETGLILEQAGQLGATADWKDVTESVSASGQTNVVQQTLTPTNRFFRLRRP